MSREKYPEEIAVYQNEKYYNASRPQNSLSVMRNYDCIMEAVFYTRSDLVPKWHRYPEEKPQEGKDIYVQLDDDSTMIARLHSDGLWYHDGEFDELVISRNTVIAWMELPQLYRDY